MFEAVPENSEGPAGIALVRLEHCQITRFGYPNDEALAGHPLYPKGLGFYGVFEVENSSLIAQLQEQNRRAFPQFVSKRPVISGHHHLHTRA